ncbi:MAG TPA: flagellar hook-basal body complex protein, partial [Burkholderiaceae bacterium]|nr:flagellar hook-basal body complex protein [Burkholderiaceae bacterium]
LTSSNPNIGDFTVQLDMETATQFGTAYAVTNLVQDGYTSGQLTGVEIDNKGIITARYSNGQTEPMGQIALADFGSVQDLGQTNGGYWVETFSSGPPSFGAPGAGKRGLVQSGALEASNVDLTAELVNMITAQRSYQANAQTIKTMDQVLSTLVNLR